MREPFLRRVSAGGAAVIGAIVAAGLLPGTAAARQAPMLRPDAWFLPAEELLGFVEIPAGPFLMGSSLAADPLAFDNERWADGRPIGEVDLPTYYIGRYEVTVAQFRAFVNGTGYAVHDPVALQAPADYPVGSVAWTDALAYCRWLERVMQESATTPPIVRTLLQEGWRITLPTEAEWEKAARGTDGRIYPWGNEPRSDRANFRASAPASVGARPCPECPWGLSDMSGNVWEWTRTPYQTTPYDPTSQRLDLEADALWIMRGGGYADTEQNVRAAVRGGADPGARRPFIGFRLALVPG